MSQLSAFVTFCRNSLNGWVRREIVDDDPWDDEQVSNSSDDEDLQKILAIDPMTKTDLPQSSAEMIQQQ